MLETGDAALCARARRCRLPFADSLETCFEPSFSLGLGLEHQDNS